MPLPDPDLTEGAIHDRRLSDLAEPALRQFYDELMVAAFPPAELLSFQDLTSTLADGSCDGTILLIGDRAVGGAVVEQCVGGRVLLLAYLVVAPGLRSGGLGARLMSTLPSLARRPDALLLAEIEDPRCHGANERGDPVARVRFYDRLGARLLPIPYFQPALYPGADRVPGMLLIVLNPTEVVSGPLVVDFLSEYFTACEGGTVLEQEPAVRELVSAARGDSTGLLALAGLDDLDAARVLAG